MQVTFENSLTNLEAVMIFVISMLSVGGLKQSGDMSSVVKSHPPNVRVMASCKYASVVWWFFRVGRGVAGQSVIMLTGLAA